MSEIRRGALLSYATILVVNLSGLLLTPFIIRALGNAEYGLYLLIGSLAAYLGVLDFGLNNAVTRYIAQCAAKRDRTQEARFLGAALVVNALAAAVIIGLGAIFHAKIDAWFSDTLDSGQRDQARIMLLLLIANVVLTVLSGMFTAICAGHERFAFPKVVNLLRYLVRIGLVFVILVAGGGAVLLVALDTALAFLVLVVNAFYAIKSIGIRVELRSLSLSLVFSVLTFSAWVFLYAVIGQVQWQAGQLVIGASIGAEAVAIYGIGIMFGGYYAAFSTAITNLFLPRATYMTVTNVGREKYSAEMVRIGRMALLILLLILGGFVLFGRDFILLWAGPEYGAAWFVATVIMLAYTVPLIQTFAHQLLEAKGMIAFKAKVYLVALPLGVALGYRLLEAFGVPGMAIGMATGWVAATIVLNIYYQYALGIDVPIFFAAVSKGILPAFVACLAFGLLLNLLPIQGWSGFFVRVAAFGSLYIILMYRFGMNGSERRQVKSTMSQLKAGRVS
ncbi:MAG: oligosaccharide flippase family protein [Pseudomonadota bacterium]